MKNLKTFLAILAALYIPALHAHADYCEMDVVKPMREESAMMNAVIEIKTVSELNRHKKPGKPMVVKFEADWCGPCKEMKEPYKQLAKDYAGITFISINGDKAPELMKEYGIEAYPTLIFLDKNGTELYRREGSISKGALMDLVDNLKNGTMQKQEAKPKKSIEEPKKTVKEEPAKKEQPASKKDSSKKSKHSKSSSRKKQSAPKEIVRKGRDGKKVRYVAVED